MARNWSKSRRRPRWTPSASPSAATPRHQRTETVLFNLLAGFLSSFAVVRISTWGIRDEWWPFRNVSVGGRHIHHFVPGILLAFASGTTALLTDDEALEEEARGDHGRRHGADLRRGRPAA